MKNLFLLTLFLFISVQFSLQAQKVKIKKGIAYVNKKAYCKIEKEGNLIKKIYTISNLENKELLYIKSLPIQLFYEINFLKDDLKMTIQQGAFTNFGKDILKKFYKAELIKNGKIDSSVLNNFIAKYSDELPVTNDNTNQTIIINGNNSITYEKISRDISKPITVYVNRIEQDFKTIGTVVSNFNSSTFFIGSSKNKVAKVTFKNNGTKSDAIIKTFSDNKIRTLTVDFVNKNKDVAEYLVRNDYL